MARKDDSSGRALPFLLPSQPGIIRLYGDRKLQSIIVQDDGSIIFYYNHVPLGGVGSRECTVDSSSKIRLLQGSVCDNDEILVDGERGTIMSVTVD